MNRTIHLSTLVALLVAAACDTQGEELDRELDIAAEADEDADADEDTEEGLEGPDGLQSDVDVSEAFAMRFAFDGACGEVADRTGVGVLWLERDGSTRGYVFDAAYPGRRLEVTGSVSENGSFEAVEAAPFGECTWTGIIDVHEGSGYGEWDCGYGCAGEWSY
jgi:hypothetical protein